MRHKLVSEVKNEHINVLLEALRSSGDTFTDWPRFMLDKFRDHFKFLNFRAKQQLTKRSEPVDFIACIVEGSADIIMEHRSQAVLKKGEFIGYMSALGMQGCEVQQFDIYAKEAGCLAILKRENLRMLSKREPEFSYYLYKTMALKTLNTLSHQYFDKDYQIKKILHTHQTSNKKLIQYLDNLGLSKYQIEDLNKSSRRGPPIQEENFRTFWNQLEQRDKRLFVQFSLVVELRPQEDLIRNGQKSNYFFILVEGELVAGGEFRNNHVYRPGDTIGLKELYTEEIYNEHVVSRMNCMLIRISKQSIIDMFHISPVSASNIISMLTRYESYKVREQFDNHNQHDKNKLQQQVEHLVYKLSNPDKPIPKKDSQSIPQLMTNYFELDIKKSDLLHMDFSEKHVTQGKSIAPLYTLDTFKEMIAKRAFQPNQIKDVKDPMNVTGLSWFMREKTEEQHHQMIKDKELAKKLKKSGVKDNNIKHLSDNEHDDFIHEKNIYDEISNENDYLKQDLQKAHEYIYLLEQGMQLQKDQHRQRAEDHEVVHTKLKKSEMHRELLQLDLGNEQLSMKKHSKQKVTLFDTYKQQAHDARKFQTTIHAADKILNYSYKM